MKRIPNGTCAQERVPVSVAEEERGQKVRNAA